MASDRIELIAFPEGAFPARFASDINATVEKIIGNMTDDEKQACREASGHVGDYEASIQIMPPEGVKNVEVKFRHTNIFKLREMIKTLVEEFSGR